MATNRKRARKRVEKATGLKVPEVKRNAPIRLSAVVKIAMFSATVYLMTGCLYLILSRFFGIDFGSSILGLSPNAVIILGEISVLAAAMTVGTKIFLMNPINKIKETIMDVTRGDFFARAEINNKDEIGCLATDFNSMLDKLTDLNTEKMRTEYELLLAREELKYKSRMEKRGKELRDTNRALEFLVKDFSLLYEIGQRVNSTIDIAELYRVIQDVLPKRLNLEKFAIMQIDDKREFLNMKASYGFSDLERVNELSFRIGEGISGMAVEKGEIKYIPDVSIEPGFLHYRGESSERGSFLAVPLRYKKDVLGVMNCSRTEKNSFTEEDIRLLTLVANQIALAVENAQLYTKTRELSVRDELTGLYNRRHFQEVLQMEWKRATRFKRPLSLLMIDIDHFKQFNDTYGHLHGDKVLKIIAGLIGRNLREVDTVARFGGEEFIVLLPDTDKDGALVVGEKLRRRVEIERFEEDRQILVLTISVGISTFPMDAREMDDLIDHADLGLYEAKDRGRNQVVMYADIDEFAGGVRTNIVAN